MHSIANNSLIELGTELQSLRLLVSQQSYQLKEQREQIANQNQKILDQEAEIQSLRRQLSLNSSNSSKPPSSDVFHPPKPKNLKPKSDKISGGQIGHKGSDLKHDNNPDKVVKHEINQCLSCGSSLHDTPVSSTEIRQVWDILLKKIVTEHIALHKQCLCGHAAKASFPKEASSYVSYGYNMQALCPYLSHFQMIPQDRLSLLFQDVFGISIHPATVANMSERLSSKLEGWIKALEAHIAIAPLKHLDETGFKIGAKRKWLHVQSTATTTLYTPKDKRGDVPKRLFGTVVSDYFASYFSKNFPQVKHVLCNAHHLRELKAIFELDGEDWASEMAALLSIANNRRDSIDPHRVSKLYDNIVERGLRYHESLIPLPSKQKNRPKRRKGHNLLRRFRKHKEAILRFLYEEGVPFTNNLAEQDIRMMKVKQKISGGFRTMKGAKIFAIFGAFSPQLESRNLISFKQLCRPCRNTILFRYNSPS